MSFIYRFALSRNITARLDMTLAMVVHVAEARQTSILHTVVLFGRHDSCPARRVFCFDNGIPYLAHGSITMR